LRLSEEGGLRLVAIGGHPLFVSRALSSTPVLAEKESFLSRLATSTLPTHIPDLTTFGGDRRDDYRITVVNVGVRSQCACSTRRSPIATGPRSSSS
jgi:hypothetical protein